MQVEKLMAPISVLIDEPKSYYSNLDESSFYGWLNEVDAITEISREGAKLKLTVPKPIDDVSFRDLISLLMRYGVDMAPLTALTTEGNRGWLEDPQAYWHQAMFS